MNVAPRRPTQRPPGRPREFDLDLALDKAIVVFSERGYSGTSISQLSEAMGLTAGSLYKAFADKRALFMAALERYLALRSETLRQALATASTGREQVRQLLAYYAESSIGAAGRQGCLLVTSAMTLSVAETEVADRISHALQANEARLQTLLQLGQQDGSIASTLDCATTARLLLCLLQGMRVVGKTGPTQQEMTMLVAQAMKMVA